MSILPNATIAREITITQIIARRVRGTHRACDLARSALLHKARRAERTTRSGEPSTPETSQSDRQIPCLCANPTGRVHMTGTTEAIA